MFIRGEDYNLDTHHNQQSTTSSRIAVGAFGDLMGSSTTSMVG